MPDPWVADADPGRYWLDGEPTTTVPANSRGLAYGDGVFRTMLVSAGRPVWLERQIAILCRDAVRLDLDADPDLIRAEVERAARTSATPFAALRVTLWRGGAGRGYAPRGRLARRLIGLSLYQPDPRAVWTVGTSRHAAWPEPFAGTKHLNRLLSVAAAREAEAQGVPEVLVPLGGPGITPWGWASGGKSCLYVIKNNIMYIKETTQTGIEGAGSNWLERMSREGAFQLSRPTQLPEPIPTDEFGLINSLLGPRAIGRIIGTPGLEAPADWSDPTAPGPHTRHLQALFAAEAGTPPLVV